MSMNANKHRKTLEKLVQSEDLPNNELVELLASHDTLTKKITCSYLTHRCNTNSDLCLLTANLMLRDCCDPNPGVRSSCITTLASLPGLQDSAIKSIFSSISDQSPIVRRSAVLACVKLYEGSSPDLFFTCGLTDLLYEGIRDSDPIVASNCLLSLEHILQNEGGIVINKGIAHYLLNRLSDFSECNLVYIFTFLMRYQPKSEEEVFAMLNLLDHSLASISPSVLISVIKLFIQLTNQYPNLKKDLLDTVQVAICKILNRNIPEITYMLCDYLLIFKFELKETFSTHFKYFLLRSKDPNYLKLKKFELIPYISTEQNLRELLMEIKPYCNDYKSYQAAIQCLTSLSAHNPEAKPDIVNILVPLLLAPSENVVASALKCFLLIGVNNSLSKEVLTAISTLISRPVIQTSCPDLILHTIASLNEQLENSTSFLEQLSSRVDVFNDETYCLLLMTAAWLFICQPAQTQLILGNILNTAFKGKNYIVKEKSALIYAILQEKTEDASKLLKPCFSSVDSKKS